MRGKVGITFASLSISAILIFCGFATITTPIEINDDILPDSDVKVTNLGHTWANYTTLQDLPGGHGVVSGTEANTHGPGIQSIREVEYSGLGVILNQFSTGLDWVELYNDGPLDVVMTGWTFYWHDQRGLSGTRTFPSGSVYTISPNEKVLLLENAGTDTESIWYIGHNIMWDETSGGIAAEIRNPSGEGVDFFRTGSDTSDPTPPCLWFAPDIIHPVPDGCVYRDTIGLMNDWEYNSGLDWIHGSQPGIPYIQYYSLEHRWRIQSLPADATDLTLFITANTNAGSNDNFQFYYSQDYIDWFPTGIVVNSDVPNEYSFSLPPFLTGFVYLKVTDTNYGEASTRDFIFIDDIRILYHNYTYVPVHNIDKDTIHPTIQEGVDLADAGNTLVQADHVNISGFKIFNGSTGVRVLSSYNNISGNVVMGHSSTGIITGWNTHHNSIFDNDVYGISFYGIQLGDNFGNSHNNSVWGNSVNDTGFFGLYVLKSWNNQLFNNTAFDNGEFGIYVKLAYDNEIFGNLLYSNVYGICLRYDSAYNTVHNNTLVSNNKHMNMFLTCGIALEFGVRANAVEDNTIVNQSHVNGTGIFVDWSDGNSISDNTINISTTGIRVNSTNAIDVVRNHISGIPAGLGMFLNNSHNGTYSNNTVTGAGWGIFINASDNNTFEANELLSNDVGMVINSTSARNLIFRNNFVGNGKHASDRHPGFNDWNETYPTGGNYWDDYSGPDIYSGPTQTDPGSDGFGDSPYYVSSAKAPPNNDWYPLMWPWGDVDNLEPEHLNHYPEVGGLTDDNFPTISLHVIDPSGVNASSIRLRVNGFLVFYDLEVVQAGYNISYLHAGGFSPGDLVVCNIIAQDNFGNELDFEWNFTVLEEFAIPLTVGWNLISFPLELADTSLVVVLESTAGNWNIVEYYDAYDLADPWKSHATFKPQSLNDLSNLDNTMAFWLYVTDASSPLVIRGTNPESTSISLKAGWNMVGYPSLDTTKTVGEALFGTTADRVLVGDTSEPYNLLEVGPTYVMQPGEGYWVHVVSDTLWVIV